MILQFMALGFLLMSEDQYVNKESKWPNVAFGDLYVHFIDTHINRLYVYFIDTRQSAKTQVPLLWTAEESTL